MSRLLHESARRLRPFRRNAAVLGCARLLLRLVCILSAFRIRAVLCQAGLLFTDTMCSTELCRNDLFLAASLLTVLLVCTPLRISTDQETGRLAGTLDENDLGFLSQCGSIWLMRRAVRLRILMKLTLLLSFVPSCLFAAAAKCIWLMIPPGQESLLPLLTVLHLGLLACAGILLPLRAAAAETALPFCFLKAPHEPAFHLLRQTFRFTRGHSGAILRMRILCSPLLLFPLTSPYMLTLLLAAEQLRTAKASRHLNPRRRTRFSGLELHAYEAAAS